MNFKEKLEEYNKLKQSVAYNESTIAKCKLMVAYLQRENARLTLYLGYSIDAEVLAFQPKDILINYYNKISDETLKQKHELERQIKELEEST